MATSIGDWYANADGRYSDNHGHDWENDDQPDRNRDSWLDRLPRTEPRIPPQRRRAEAPRKARNGRKALPVPRHADRAPRHYLHEVVNAAHALREKHPAMGDEELARRLRDRGFTTIKKRDIRKLLRRDPGPTPNNRPNSEKQTKRAGSLPVPVGRPVVSGRMGDFAVAVRAFWIKDPDLSVRVLTRLLRDRGWITFTEDDVKKVLRSLTSSDPHVKSPRKPARKSRSLKSRRKARGAAASLQGRVDICPSCGVAVSSLGRCRCS